MSNLYFPGVIFIFLFKKVIFRAVGQYGIDEVAIAKAIRFIFT
jgi:hypothetical protein